MSPGQIHEETLDARSDIFSFGAVLYEMLSGQRPFESNTRAESIVAILEREPPALSGPAAVPQELQRIVSKCLEKDRDRRYSSARDLASDLTNVLQKGRLWLGPRE